MTASRQVTIGRHHAVLEPSGLLVFTFDGVIHASDVATYVTLRDTFLAGLPCVLTLVDLRSLEGIEPGSRRDIASMRESRPQATAFIGGTFQLRVISQMVVKAIRIFGGRKLAFRFFEDELTARAWLEEMGRAYRGIATGPG